MYFPLAILMLTSCVFATEMDPKTLEGFQSAIYGKIMAHLDAQYQLLQPDLLEHNRSLEICKEQIATVREECRSCASGQCQGNFGDWIMGGFSEIGGWFQGAGNSFVDWQGWQEMGGFFGKIGNWFEGAGNSFVNWKGFDDMANFFSGIGDAFSDGFNSVKNTLGDFGSSVGNGFKNVGSKIGNGFKSVFSGRRRSLSHAMLVRKLKTIRQRYMAKRQEELDKETKQCMRKCDTCTPFLGDQTALIGGVCGEQILVDEAALTEIMSDMQALYTANGNPLQDTLPIVSKIEFDPTTISFTDFSVGGVYVTAITPTGERRYPSKYRYYMQSPQTTAAELGKELIDIWFTKP